MCNRLPMCVCLEQLRVGKGIHLFGMTKGILTENLEV